MSTILRLSLLMQGLEEARILTWSVAPGDRFSSGQVLAELESDKAVIELTAECDGVIEELLVPAGDAARVGQGIARIRSEETR